MDALLRRLLPSLLLIFMAEPVWADADSQSVSDPLPPGMLTTSQHSDAWKIKNALSAAPASIAEKATVMDWPTDKSHPHGRILRPGSNGWTCMPDEPGKPQHNPMCADETMMKWIMASLAGKKPHIDRIGLSYMLLGEVGADIGDLSAPRPAPGKDWYFAGPHVMLVLPDDDAAALRDINEQPATNGPYVRRLRYPGSTPLLVLPVAKAGERVVAVQPQPGAR
jgi:hypothetical protein